MIAAFCTYPELLHWTVLVAHEAWLGMAWRHEGKYAMAMEGVCTAGRTEDRGWHGYNAHGTVGADSGVIMVVVMVVIIGGRLYAISSIYCMIFLYIFYRIALSILCFLEQQRQNYKRIKKNKQRIIGCQSRWLAYAYH